MSKRIKQTSSAFSIGILFIGVFALWNVFLPLVNQKGGIISAAYADDDGESDDEGEEDDNYSSSAATSTGQKAVKVKPVYKTVLVEKIITMLDPIFIADTDKDDIVDGLDPHPTVPESEYFTDDDNDGVANAFDIHVGEDDFAYYEQENDANGNGILDSYETVAGN